MRGGSSQALSAAPNPAGKDVPQQWAREVLLPTLEPLWALTSGGPRTSQKLLTKLHVCVHMCRSGEQSQGFPRPSK